MGMTLAIVTALLVGLLRSEVDAWLPWLVKKLHAIAVGRVPDDLRARYSEEWLADLNDTPGILTKVASAVGLIYAGSVISRQRERRTGTISGDALRFLIERGLALFLLGAYLPLLLIAALAIKTTAGGVVLFQQRQYGADGKLIFVHRFRTLGDDNTPFAVGRFLRRTSFNKLPMLWDVVLGRLSLVGPRPTAFILQNAVINEDCAQLLAERPGLLGLHRVFEESTEELSVKKQAAYCRERTMLSDIALCFFVLFRELNPFTK